MITDNSNNKSNNNTNKNNNNTESVIIIIINKITPITGMVTWVVDARENNLALRRPKEHIRNKIALEPAIEV
jgi:hypothetical protein